MQAHDAENVAHRFGEFTFQPSRRRLLVRGQPAVIGARALDVLTALVARRDRIVTPGELLDVVWPGLAVEENNVQVQISALRKLLGRHVIATNPGRGYQFIANLEELPTAGQWSVHPSNTGPDEPRIEPLDAHNLPEPDNELIGRETDCAMVEEALGAARLVTVVGPAGIGKTRVALEVARNVISRFADGIWWVDLAALSSAESLAEAIATASGVALGQDNAIESLARALKRRRMLVVLDNCERVAADLVGLLSRVMECSPGLKVLATSQIPLTLRTEQCYRLGPLGLPGYDASTETMRSAPAIALLVKRASETDMRFRVTDVDLPLAAGICIELDGLPLAIELAAARLPALGLRALQDMLHQRFELLVRQRADAPSRQRTLQAALDWSREMLSPTEREALDRLSTFNASFRLSSAVDVIAAPTRLAAVGTLDSLVAKSLVQANPRAPGRYRMLESTRLHAAGELKRSESADAVHARRRSTVSGLARESERAFWEQSDDAWIAALRDDQPDIVAAFEEAAELGNFAMAGDLGQVALLWDHLQGVGGAVRRRMKTAASLLRSVDRLPADGAAGGLLNMLTFFGEMQSTPQPAWRHACEQRVTAWWQQGDVWQLYRAKNALAVQRASESRQVDANALLREAADLESPSWPARLLGSGAYANALVGMLTSDIARYRDCAAETLALTRRAGAVQDEMWGRVLVADALVLAGNPHQAIALVDPLATEAETRGQAFVYIGSMALLSFAHLIVDDFDSGRDVARRALVPAQENFLVDLLLASAAMLFARNGEVESAGRLLGCCPPYRPNGRRGWASEVMVTMKTHRALSSLLPSARLAELQAEGAALKREQRLDMMATAFATRS